MLNFHCLCLDLIKKQLEEGFDEQDNEQLFMAFIFQRQFSLEGDHAFTNYSDWFQVKTKTETPQLIAVVMIIYVQKHFGSSNSSLMKSARNCRFFIKFLTNILSHDTAKFLKVLLLA